MKGKCILLILDGLGDRAFRELSNQTPLQAAHTPNLDKLAARGSSGLYHATFQGQALPSEIAHLLMYGYELSEFPGRGPLETLGIGYELGKNDVAMLSHFVCLRKTEKGFILENGTPVISSAESDELAKLLHDIRIDDIQFEFVPSGGIWGALVLKGDVCSKITDSDPVYNGNLLSDVIPLATHKKDSSASRTSKAVRKYLRHVCNLIEQHNREKAVDTITAVNGLVTQRSGKLTEIDPFEIKYGLKGLSIASGLIHKGLGRFVGFDFLNCRDSNNSGDDLAERLQLAIENLNNYDFIHVHTKSPDKASHKKDPIHTKQTIQDLDQGIGKMLDHLLKQEDLCLVVTSDHSTPSCGTMIHSGETVPLLITGKWIRKDSVTRFDEISAAAGCLGQVRGKELMHIILSSIDRAGLSGLRRGAIERPYIDMSYMPLSTEE